MSGSPALTRPAIAYIAANVLVAAALLVVSRDALTAGGSALLITWLVANVAAEWLWIESITGQGLHSMASTFNFAAIFLLSRSEAVWVVAIAVLVGALTFQRRPWYRALFAGANVAIVVFLAATVFRALSEGPPSLEAFQSPAAIVPFLATGVTFFLANTFGVSAAIALAEKQPLMDVWRTNFAYDFEMLGTVALFLISPILVLTYLAIGAPAFVLFALPLIVIRKGNRDYIDLQRTQASVVAAERLAAKGEMAAGIAHELNNYLAALRGGTQLMERQIRNADTARVEKRLGLIREQVDNMTILTRGLMEFAHRDVSLARVDLAELVTKTVTFLAPQNRFDGLEIHMGGLPPVVVEVDPAQIQQVLVNLLNNAADALGQREDARPVIGLELRRDKKHVHLSVRDEGPGMTEAVRARIFEPTFTTKPDGHGFGLATCHRIAENHGGRLVVDTEPGRGTTMTLTLPLRRRGRRGGDEPGGGDVSRRDEAAPRERDDDTDRSRSQGR